MPSMHPSRPEHITTHDSPRASRAPFAASPRRICNNWTKHFTIWHHFTRNVLQGRMSPFQQFALRLRVSAKHERRRSEAAKGDLLKFGHFCSNENQHAVRSCTSEFPFLLAFPFHHPPSSVFPVSSLPLFSSRALPFSSLHLPVSALLLLTFPFDPSTRVLHLFRLFHFKNMQDFSPTAMLPSVFNPHSLQFFSFVLSSSSSSFLLAKNPIRPHQRLFLANPFLAACDLCPSCHLRYACQPFLFFGHSVVAEAGLELYLGVHTRRHDAM